MDHSASNALAYRLSLWPSGGCAVMAVRGEARLILSGELFIGDTLAASGRRLAVGIIDADNGPGAAFEYRATCHLAHGPVPGWNWFRASIPCNDGLPATILIDLVAEAEFWMFERAGASAIRLSVPRDVARLGVLSHPDFLGWVTDLPHNAPILSRNAWPLVSGMCQPEAVSLSLLLQSAYAISVFVEDCQSAAGRLMPALARINSDIVEALAAGAIPDPGAFPIIRHLALQPSPPSLRRAFLKALASQADPRALEVVAGLRLQQAEMRAHRANHRALYQEVLAPWLQRVASRVGGDMFARLKELECRGLNAASVWGMAPALLAAIRDSAIPTSDPDDEVPEPRGGDAALQTSLYLAWTAPTLLSSLALCGNPDTFAQSIERLRRAVPVYLVVTRLGYPMGGGEALMRQTCRFMSALGYRAIWVNFAGSDDRPHAFSEQIDTPDYLDVRIASEMTDVAIADAISHFAPDIVHSQGATNAMVADAARRLRVPALLGYHFWDGLVSLGATKNVAMMDNIAVHSAAADFGPCRWIRRYVASEFMLDVYRSLGGTAPLEVFYPTSEPTHYRVVQEGDAGFILHINIHRLKGGAILLDCLEALGAEMPFLVVRTEPGSEVLDRAVADAVGQTSSSRYEGYGDAREWYRQARMVIVPSLVDETFCRVAFEAAMNGIPVLSTRAGFLPMMLGETGFYLGDDSADWIEALRALYADTERLAAIGAAQREHVLTAFGQNQDRFLDAVMALTAQSPRRNVGLMTAWADQGLGNQTRLYAQLYREAGLRCHVLSYQPYAASEISLTTQSAPDDWAVPKAADSVYYSYNNREALTREEITQFCAVNHVGTLVVPEICWAVNWDRLLSVSMPNLSICGVPNIEIVRRAEAPLHDRLAKTFFNTRVAETILYALGVRNGARIGHGFGLASDAAAVARKQTRLMVRPMIRYLHVAGHNPGSRKQTAAVVAAFAKALEQRSDLVLVVTCMMDLPEVRRSLGAAVDMRIGTLGHADIMALYADSDVSVQVSSHEGLGLGFYESLSAITPVITLDVAPHNEVIIAGRSGWHIGSRVVALADNDDAVVAGAIVDQGDLCRLFVTLEKPEISRMFASTALLHAERFTETALLGRLVETLP